MSFGATYLPPSSFSGTFNPNFFEYTKTINYITDVGASTFGVAYPPPITNANLFSVSNFGITNASTVTPGSGKYLPIKGGTMQGAINMNTTNAILNAASITAVGAITAGGAIQGLGLQATTNGVFCQNGGNVEIFGGGEIIMSDVNVLYQLITRYYGGIAASPYYAISNYFTGTGSSKQFIAFGDASAADTYISFGYNVAAITPTIAFKVNCTTGDVACGAINAQGLVSAGGFFGQVYVSAPSVRILGATSGSVNMSCGAVTTTYNMIYPTSVSAGAITSDSSGNLTFVPSLPLSGGTLSGLLTAGAGLTSTAGTTTLGSTTINGDVTATGRAIGCATVTATGLVTSAGLTTTGDIVATGRAIGCATVTATGLVTSAGLTTTGDIVATGRAIGCATVTATGLVTSAGLTSTGDLTLTSHNIASVGAISATGLFNTTGDIHTTKSLYMVDNGIVAFDTSVGGLTNYMTCTSNAAGFSWWNASGGYPGTQIAGISPAGLVTSVGLTSSGNVTHTGCGALFTPITGSTTFATASIGDNFYVKTGSTGGSTMMRVDNAGNIVAAGSLNGVGLTTTGAITATNQTVACGAITTSANFTLTGSHASVAAIQTNTTGAVFGNATSASTTYLTADTGGGSCYIQLDSSPSKTTFYTSALDIEGAAVTSGAVTATLGAANAPTGMNTTPGWFPLTINGSLYYIPVFQKP